jgi:hypothetical protein
MSISTYFRPNIHQNGPKILGVKPPKKGIELGWVTRALGELGRKNLLLLAASPAKPAELRDLGD